MMLLTIDSLVCEDSSTGGASGTQIQPLWYFDITVKTEAQDHVKFIECLWFI